MYKPEYLHKVKISEAWLQEFYYNLTRTHDDIIPFDNWLNRVAFAIAWKKSGVVFCYGESTSLVWTNIYIEPGTFPRKKYFLTAGEYLKVMGVKYVAISTSDEFGEKFASWLSCERLEKHLYRKVL